MGMVMEPLVHAGHGFDVIGDDEQIMAHHQDGHLGVQGFKEFVKVGLTLGVDAGRGFVKEEQAWFYKDILAVSYDEEFARVRGIPVNRIYFGLIALLGLTVVMVIQVVGLIMVIALLTIPPFMMEKYAKSLGKMMIGSSILGACFTLSGLWLSYQFDLTSGAAIILVAGIAFLTSLALDKLGETFRQNRQAGNAAGRGL